jgi:hypothetical protein
VLRSLLCAALLGAIPAAHAVFTFISFATPRTITLQVGAAGATINNVVFDVIGANVSPTPTPVTGVPDASTPATSPAGGVRIRLSAQWPSGNSNVRLTVSSPAGLACVGVSYEHDVTYPTVDIQNGSFGGTANQALAAFSCCGGGSVQMANTLVFQYNNATLYPAGSYQGRVTYTASTP